MWPPDCFCPNSRVSPADTPGPDPCAGDRGGPSCPQRFPKSTPEQASTLGLGLTPAFLPVKNTASGTCSCQGTLAQHMKIVTGPRTGAEGTRRADSVPSPPDLHRQGLPAETSA